MKRNPVPQELLMRKATKAKVRKLLATLKTMAVTKERTKARVRSRVRSRARMLHTSLLSKAKVSTKAKVGREKVKEPPH